jgi:hypothetical protein
MFPDNLLGRAASGSDRGRKFQQMNLGSAACRSWAEHSNRFISSHEIWRGKPSRRTHKPDRRTRPIVPRKCARPFKCWSRLGASGNPGMSKTHAANAAEDHSHHTRQLVSAALEIPGTGAGRFGTNGRTDALLVYSCVSGRAVREKRPICIRPLEGGRPAHEVARRLPRDADPIKGSKP